MNAGEIAIRTLIVDDELELLDSLKSVLERRRMKVLTSDSGKKALDLLKENVVDVVVLDIKMPGMDGLEVLKIIKKDYPDIPVLLLTGHPTVESALKGIKLGANEYIMKPPDVEMLVERIRQAYDRQQEIFAQRQSEKINDIRKRRP
jgi:DNA-binding NtrC family response regulator